MQSDVVAFEPTGAGWATREIHDDRAAALDSIGVFEVLAAMVSGGRH